MLNKPARFPLTVVVQSDSAHNELITRFTPYSVVARPVDKSHTNSGNNMPLFIRLVPPINNGSSTHKGDPSET